MELKFTNNLFLGLPELEHFKESIVDSGYKLLMKQYINSYGIVRTSTDSLFTSLQVISSGIGTISVKAGVAIDSNLNVIRSVEDVTQSIVVPNDGFDRYITIRYNETIVETGTVNIEVNGSIVGTDTSFTKRLRGLPNFPSKIKFLDSNNNGEYIIQAVQSDTVATINIAQGQITPEEGVKYSIIGTFTPGIDVAEEEKYPLISDGYIIEARLSEDVEVGQEFLLARVNNTGGNISIEDLRTANEFGLLFNEEATSGTSVAKSPSAAITQLRFIDNEAGTIDSSEVTFDWGFRSDTWSVDSTTRTLRMFRGQGGSWDDNSLFTDGDFDGHQVVFSNGQIVDIISSTIDSSNEILLELEFKTSYTDEGAITIVPKGFIEVQITHTTKGFTYNKGFLSFTNSGKGTIELPVGTYRATYRLRDDAGISTHQQFNNGSYLTEASFNTNGFVNTGSEIRGGSINGLFTVAQSSNSLTNLLNNQIPTGAIIDFYGVSDVPTGYWPCDGSIIVSANSILNGERSPDLRGRVTAGLDVNQTDYNAEGKIGGSNQITLTESQLPSHTHTLEIDEAGNHTHTTLVELALGGGQAGAEDGTGGSVDRESSAAGNHTHTGDIGNTGGGQQIDIRQPFFTLNKYIKL